MLILLLSAKILLLQLKLKQNSKTKLMFNSVRQFLPNQCCAKPFIVYLGFKFLISSNLIFCNISLFN